jgi:DNA-binding response OmpR family regulator
VGHVFLIHWKQEEVASFAEPLRDAGWRVDTAHGRPEDAARDVEEARPDAVVLSLRRDPERSWRVASLLAGGQAADTPVVAVDGDDETVAAVRQALPDVRAVEWTDLPATLRAVVDGRA